MLCCLEPDSSCSPAFLRLVDESRFCDIFRLAISFYSPTANILFHTWIIFELEAWIMTVISERSSEASIFHPSFRLFHSPEAFLAKRFACQSSWVVSSRPSYELRWNRLEIIELEKIWLIITGNKAIKVQIIWM